MTKKKHQARKSPQEKDDLSEIEELALDEEPTEVADLDIDRDKDQPTEKKSKKAEPADDELMEEGLEAIYGQERVDFSKMDRHSSRLTNILTTVVIVLLVIAVMAWTGFFIYNKYFAPETEQQFNIDIDVPDQLTSGEAATIKINYHNPTAVPIATLVIDVRLPDAFEVATFAPLPDDEAELIWEIGTLAAGSDGTIAIDGRWLAEVPSNLPVQALADFRPANFNAFFQDIETKYITTLESTLEVDFDGPEEATSGDQLDYTITLKNTGEQDLANAELSLELPDGFYLEESEPAVEAGQAPSWSFELLEAEQEVSVTFRGSFAADAEGFQYFDVVAALQRDEQALVQAKTQGFTDVAGTNFELQLVAAGSAEDIAIDLSDQLRVSIAYENTGASTLDEVSMRLDFQSELPMPIAWDSAELDGGTQGASGVSWSTDVLGPLEPGDKQVLNLVIPIQDSIGEGQADSFSLICAATLDGQVIRSSPIEISINTEADFSAKAVYFTDEGAPLGNGPLPPELGERTTYRIFWQVDNSLHDLEDLSVTAVLPPHVTWEDQAQADLGSVSYDPTGGTVTWRVTNLPTSINSLSANFALSITPDDDDLGKFIKLISGSTMSATDAVTGTSLQQTTESLNSDLENDEYASGKGIVIE